MNNLLGDKCGFPSIISLKNIGLNSPLNSKKVSELFEIQDCIGKGNFGDVYKAIDKTTNEIVAIKVINLEDTDEPIELLAQEIYFLSELRSPFITQYKAAYLEDVSIWIIMEYCGGGSCTDLIKYLHTHRLTEEQVSYIIRDVLYGLEYLHGQRKIHRDIKSANILLTSNGKVKLADFGVSGQMKVTRRRDTFVGTPFWMAPEVISRQCTGYDEKADIWSLGITVIELLTGHPPLSRIDPMKALLLIPKKESPKLDKTFSSYARDFVAQCLLKDPVKRPTTTELLKHKFLRKYHLENLSSEVNAVLKFKSLTNCTKKPKYELSNKVYKTGFKHSLEKWNFDEHDVFLSVYNSISKNPKSSNKSKRAKPIEEVITSRALSPETQISPISDAIISLPSKTPVTNVTIPTDLSVYYARDSGTPLSGINPIMPSQAMEKELNFLNHIIIYSLKRLYERARDKKTRDAVEQLSYIFKDIEIHYPGLSQAFSEEISRRMNCIKTSVKCTNYR